MKRIKIITLPAIEQTIKEVSVYGCDICGHEDQRANNFKNCYLCKRFVCDNYSKRCGNDDPREIGDYPDFYCNICFDLKFRKYDQEYLYIEKEYSNKLELLEQKIKEESLAH